MNHRYQLPFRGDELQQPGRGAEEAHQRDSYQQERLRRHPAQPRHTQNEKRGTHGEEECVSHNYIPPHADQPEPGDDSERCPQGGP